MSKNNIQSTLTLLKEALLSINLREKALTETDKDKIVQILSKILQTFNQK
jgi:hypothetical protein